VLGSSLRKGTPSITSTKYIGMDVHKESISIAVLNFAGKVVMECFIETKPSTILQFIDGLRGEVQVTFEEGTSAAWLYDLLRPRVGRNWWCAIRERMPPCEGTSAQLPHHHERSRTGHDVRYTNRNWLTLFLPSRRQVEKAGCCSAHQLASL
jgi:hypothetical protein